jgi:nicotine blue oxidoreductase
VRIAAVVLAAGEGRRIGGPKALVLLRDRSFAAHALASFDRGDVAERVIVLGKDAEHVAATAGLPPGVRVVVNARWREGMLTSVWAGLDAAEAAGAEAVLVHPVDNPLVADETVRVVIEALEKGATIAVPAHWSTSTRGTICARCGRRPRRRRPAERVGGRSTYA